MPHHIVPLSKPQTPDHWADDPHPDSITFAIAILMLLASFAVGVIAIMMAPSDIILESQPDTIMGLGFLLAVVGFYFLPTILAAARHHHNTLAIGALNFLLGWTLLGWIAALVWAFTRHPDDRMRS